MIMQTQRSALNRYLVAIAAVCVAASIQAVFFLVLGISVPAVALFLTAVGFSAWYGGAGPSLLAIIVGGIISDGLSQSLHQINSTPQRAVEAFALIIGGVLSSAMMLYRAKEAKMRVERAIDANARRRTEEHLLHERHRMQVLLEHTPDYIYFKDLQSRFVLVSPSLVKYFGLQHAEQIIGKSDFDVFTRVYAQAAFDDEQNVIRTGVALVNKEEKETWPSGRISWASTTKLPFRDANGVIIGTFGISRDITQQKFNEEALRDAKMAAESATEAKSNFLANMSHELRTPLSAILGMSEILLDTGLTPEQQEFAEIIHSSGHGLVAMLNDILDFSKNEAGHIELESIPFDLALAIDEVVHLHSANAEAKKLELIERISPGAPSRLLGDPGRLRQILSNLIGNAIKFTDQGHVYIDVNGTVIDDNNEKDGENEKDRGNEKIAQLTFNISDTGIGISADKLQTIFDKFTQADSSTTRRFGGTGLGLAICKQLAEAMGGNFHVTSVENTGSTFSFTVTLPIASGTATILPAQIDLSGVRVLVVEGNAIHRRVIEEQLASWGCPYESFSTAQEALTATDRHPCHIAIIDTYLVDMHGLDLGPALRRQQHGEQLGLILLTTIGRRGDAKKAESSGFNAYLVKPVRQLDLRDTISAVHQAQLSGTLTGIVTRHSLAENRGHSSTMYRNKMN
jgi:two-component system, sensor histidine kinase and response regulator